MKRNLLILMAIFGLAGKMTAQTEDGFKPSGSPVFLVFSNVHASLNKDGYSPAFELTRLLLGYQYDFSKSLSARANIDIGDPGTGNLKMTAYVKHAFLQYKTEAFSGKIGMVSTDQFNLIERQWGYRYIFKSLQDEWGYGPSSDLGAGIEFTPADFISLDASVLNGEGFRNVQSDSAFKYTIGITLKPYEGLQLRTYTDFMKKENLQNTISFFAGYPLGSFRVGLEYSYQKNNRMIAENNLSGTSAFASVKVAGNIALLARYDNAWSATHQSSDDPWNFDRDGQLFIAGLEFSPVKGIKIAPVYTGWLPANRDKPFTSTPGIYFEIRL
ncbi:MAG TPA: hypothetical protein VK207_07075 [Bacteroidales bacterium]|nr:hypothetical protein [Bacteroidales bacterium]